ncbi:MAG: hypothetical protein HY924_15320 [Elusimicrobia bacterium]|nr:hypothetical protein [Elusimicrobiota bacterium]
MRFEFTPEEARPVAGAVAQHFRQRKMAIQLERPAWPNAPCRTTLLATKANLKILVEAQGTLSYDGALKELATWLSARRLYCEFFLATTSEALSKVGLLEEMKLDGVGLLVINDHRRIYESIHARNPALVITPEPSLKLGPCRAEVGAAVEKFNLINRKDGLRDMCEMVERETDVLALKAARSGWLTASPTAVEKMDWSTKINALASNNSYAPPHVPVVGHVLKDDLHSFRNARNLVDHKVKGKRDDMRRQMQFAERMMQGPRLIAELLSCKRKIK